MDFVKQWRRRAFGAAGATVVAPAAVVLGALAVGVAGGGIQGLGSLGQMLTGPNLPTAAASSETGKARRGDHDASELLVAAASARQQAAARELARTPAGTERRGTRRRDAGSRGRPGTSPRPNPPAGQPTPTPTPTATPSPSTVRQVGNTVTPVVRQVPVVGDTGADVVEQIVTTADEVCTGLPVCPQRLP